MQTQLASAYKLRKY